MAHTACNRRQIPDDKSGRRKCQLPDATVIPALVSTFESRVTLLERVTVRSAQVCAVSRLATLSQNGHEPGSSPFEFPRTKAEAPSTDPEQTIAIRHRLPELSLASSFLRS